jgi:hypothetical protein
MLDFGSALPLNYVYERTPDCWCAYYCRLGMEEERAANAGLGHRGEMYFLWQPREHSEPLGDPDEWGYVEEVPHEFMYVRVRRDPLYLLSDVEIDLVHRSCSLGSSGKGGNLYAYWLPWSSGEGRGGQSSDLNQ